VLETLAEGDVQYRSEDFEAVRIDFALKYAG
jgi:hypothetical protein